MPVLNISDDEAALIIKSLETEGARVIQDQIRLEFPADNRFPRNFDEAMSDLKTELYAVTDLRLRVIDANDEADCVSEAEAKRRTAVANMIIAEIDAAERAARGTAPTESTPAPRAGSGWHHKHGWLQSTLNQLEELKAFDDARKEGTAARRRLSEQLAAFHETTELKPGTWTTLPDGYEVDADPFEITDPEDTVNAALFSRFNAREYDRIEIGVNGDRRSRYTVRKEDLENFLRDIRERFSDRY